MAARCLIRSFRRCPLSPRAMRDERIPRGAFGGLAGFVFFIATVLWAPSAPAYSYVHEVLPGERLKDIAKRYHTSPAAIRRRNRLQRKRGLRAGRKLKIVTSIPSRPLRKIRYSVVRGDSLSRIARKHKMKLWVLKRLNRRAARRPLRQGQRLWVVQEGPRPHGGVKGLYRLGPGPGYVVRDPRRAWGTLLTVTRINEVLGDFAGRFPKAPKLRVMDLSREGGGYFPPHRSHRSGRDVDIGYPKKRKYRRYSRTRPKMLDLARTWYVIERLLATRDVTFIFMDYALQGALYRYAKARKKVPKKTLAKLFQYPRGRRSLSGIIRYEPGHATHFHVRFRKETRAEKRSRLAATKKGNTRPKRPGERRAAHPVTSVEQRDSKM